MAHATGGLNGLLGAARRAGNGPGLSDLTDAELLAGFLAGNDEAAFEVLVRRHGRMVLGVCRRVLRNEADAEDAFQATFLVLARKAASVRPPSQVGPWLYGVAYRTARKARTMTERRRAVEARATRPESPGPVPPDGSEVLDEELNHLPEKLRAAVVLCELEGQTLKQAAEKLACPPGTVASRLARGRALLGERLRKRGLAVIGGALASLLAQGAATAAVPGPLVLSTVKSAALVAAGGPIAAGAVSLRVATLIEGELKTMLLHKLKATGALLVAMMALVGAGVLSLAAREPERPAQALREQERPAKAANPEPEKDGTAVFPGKWVNVVKDSVLTRRVVIEKEKKGGWTVQMAGMYNGKEVSGHKLKLRLLVGTLDIGENPPAWAHTKVPPMRGFAFESDKIADRSYTLHVEKDQLILEQYNIYKDDRPHRHVRSVFKKAK